MHLQNSGHIGMNLVQQQNAVLLSVFQPQLTRFSISFGVANHPTGLKMIAVISKFHPHCNGSKMSTLAVKSESSHSKWQAAQLY